MPMMYARNSSAILDRMNRINMIIVSYPVDLYFKSLTFRLTSTLLSPKSRISPIGFPVATR